MPYYLGNDFLKKAKIATFNQYWSPKVLQTATLINF